MYYKRLQNNTVTDVVERKQFLRWQEKHGMLVPCDEAYACGILATDGKTYHVDALPEIPLPDVETVYPVSRAEYLTLAEQLAKTVEPLIGDVAILREQLRAQAERNDMLEECLLEISQEVYK